MVSHAHAGAALPDLLNREDASARVDLRKTVVDQRLEACDIEAIASVTMG